MKLASMNYDQFEGSEPDVKFVMPSQEHEDPNVYWGFLVEEKEGFFVYRFTGNVTRM